MLRETARRFATFTANTKGGTRTGGSGTTSVATGPDGFDGSEDDDPITTAGRDNPAGWGSIVALILLPIVMIMFGTVGGLLVDEDSTAAAVVGFVGAPAVALLVTTALAYWLIGVRRGLSSQQIGQALDSGLAPAAIIILVTGAGGVFGRVLTESGIGDALAGSLSDAGLPLIVSLFVVAAALRASQGSATVAIVTTLGLLGAAVTAGDYTVIQVSLLVLATGFGALGFSHVNDSGFWVVTRFLGLSVGDGLRTWTVLTTALGVAGFLITFLLWGIVSAAGL